jgi:hypothetical protein
MTSVAGNGGSKLGSLNAVKLPSVIPKLISDPENVTETETSVPTAVSVEVLMLVQSVKIGTATALNTLLKSARTINF